MSKRIVITGYGIICSAGNSAETVQQSILSGRQCFLPINNASLDHLKVKFAGLIDGRLLSDSSKKILADTTRDRFVNLAIIAASEAVAHSSIDLNQTTGLFFGTCSGPMLTIEHHYQQQITGNMVLSGDDWESLRYYTGAYQLAQLLKIEGPVITTTTACSAGTLSIATACDAIKCGLCDQALAGGADSFAASTQVGFDGLKATSAGYTTPFSIPAGLNLGEGSAFVVLEEFGAAQKRGATVYAEIAGSGTSNDAYHCSAPDPSACGMIAAMERACIHANISKSDIAYVNAHGTGTEANDKTESRGMIKVFGTVAAVPSVSSVKSMVGHCLGAAGVVETVATLLCAQKSVCPPNGGFTTPRTGCTLEYVPAAGCAMVDKPLIMKNSFAFGGNNATVILRRPGSQSTDRPLSDEPICITGIGVISPAGVGIQALTAAQKISRQCLTGWNHRNNSVSVGRVPFFDPKAIERRIDTRAMDNASIYAIAAAKQALTMSGYPEKPSTLEELGSVLGVAIGPSRAEKEFLTDIFTHNYHLQQVNVFPYIVPNSVAGTLCKTMALMGYNATYACGSGAGLSALILSYIAMRNNHCTAMLVGAVDELSDQVLIDSYHAGKIDQARGLIPGEGAVFFMLETASHAHARNAKVLAQIAGCAQCFINPALEQSQQEHLIFKTITRALTSADITINDISILSCENPTVATSNALKKIFADRSNQPSLIPLIGNAQASLPLFNLAGTLAHERIDETVHTNYIFSLFSSSQGLVSAMVLKA